MQLASQGAKPPRRVLVPVPVTGGVEFDGVLAENVALKENADMQLMRSSTSSQLEDLTLSYSSTSQTAFEWRQSAAGGMFRTTQSANSAEAQGSAQLGSSSTSFRYTHRKGVIETC